MDSVVEKREKNGMENDLVKNALHIVSIDNIDLLQPGAQVYYSVQHHSWHEQLSSVFNPDLRRIQIHESALVR